MYKFGFSYVNNILWKIFFDSFFRGDWIQKKKYICPRTVLPCFYVMDGSIVGQSPDFLENGKRNYVSGKFSKDSVTKTDQRLRRNALTKL